MEPIDESLAIEQFFARKHTAPEGTSTEELDRLNYYLRKATQLATTTTTDRKGGVLVEDIQRLLQCAMREGLEEEIIHEILEEAFQGQFQRFLSEMTEEAMPMSSSSSPPSNDDSSFPFDTITRCRSNDREDESYSDPHLTNRSDAIMQSRSHDSLSPPEQTVDDFITHLAPPEGATTEEISLLNFYTKKASEWGEMKGEGGREELREMLRRVEGRIGVSTVDLMMGVFDEAVMQGKVREGRGDGRRDERVVEESDELLPETAQRHESSPETPQRHESSPETAQRHESSPETPQRHESTQQDPPPSPPDYPGIIPLSSSLSYHLHPSPSSLLHLLSSLSLILSLASHPSPSADDMGDILRSASEDNIPLGFLTEVFEESYYAKREKRRGFASGSVVKEYVKRAMVMVRDGGWGMREVVELVKEGVREGVNGEEILKVFKEGVVNEGEGLGPVLSQDEELQHQPIKSFVTVEDVSSEEDVEDYVAKYAPPEGATAEEIDKLNYYIKQAAALSAAKMNNDGHVKYGKERMRLLENARMDDVSLDIIKDILDAEEAHSPDSESSDSSAASTSSYKFSEIQFIDESEEISAFLAKFTQLKAGGHFPDAIVEGIGIPDAIIDDGDDDAVEVDLNYGFVKKDLVVSIPELNDEERLWKETNETDLFVKYADFLERLSTPSSTAGAALITPSSATSSTPKIHVAELRDVKDDLAEVYLVDESANVEVAFVDEDEELKATEKSRNKIKWRFGWQFEKGLKRPPDVVLGRRVTTKAGVAKRSTYFSKTEKIENLERMLQERDARVVRDYENKNLLANWSSPWEKRWMEDKDTKRIRDATHDERRLMKFKAYQESLNTNTIQMASIGGVSSVKALRLRQTSPGHRIRRIPVKQQWKLNYDERTRDHGGYFMVDVHSLYESSIVIGDAHRFDYTPWEFRDVRQRFLGERSLEVRNWFGRMTETRLCDRYREPICHPKSMEMPMENIPEPGEWTEDWYTTWKSRKENPNNLTLHARDEQQQQQQQQQLPEDYDGNANIGGDDWDDAPEVGTICTVRLRIGERVSRVHFAHTSHLRRSKWRKKYACRGIYPHRKIARDCQC